MAEELERASDLEREQTVVSLREGLVAGRLTLEEFSERVGAAYAAQLRGDLAGLREDLPDRGSEPLRRRPLRLSAAIFGHLVRRGRLRLRRRTAAVATFADLDLDLREAVIDSKRVVVRVYALFGNADVYVPEGIDVEVGGMIVFGHARDWGRDAALSAEPRLSVRVYGCFGTVDVWRVPNGVRGSYGEIIKQVRARQGELPA
ncbi:MAG: DUF1707 SHOCT-like domain-containing protein [Gaiellaceae bacterium]